jgi:hypothetical protein
LQSRAKIRLRTSELQPVPFFASTTPQMSNL